MKMAEMWEAVNQICPAIPLYKSITVLIHYLVLGAGQNMTSWLKQGAWPRALPPSTMRTKSHVKIDSVLKPPTC